MYKQRVTVRNKTGLHARPASEFVKCASKYSSQIKILNVKNEDEEANAKSIVMVLSLTGILGKGLGFVTGAAMDGMDALLTRIFFGA